MKFNEKIKLMVSSLVLAPFMAFSVVNATENINFEDIIKIKLEDVQNQPLTYYNDEIDSNIKLRITNSVEGFKIDLLFYKLNDELHNHHPMFENCLDSGEDLKLVIQNLNNETIWESYLNECFDCVDENGKLADLVETINLFNNEGGIYNIYFCCEDNIIGSFKNVKFEKMTK